MRREEGTDKMILLRIVNLEVRMHEVPENNPSDIKDAIANDKSLKLLEYMQLIGKNKVIPAYKKKPKAGERITRNLAKVMKPPKCSGDFCSFNFDKYEQFYDPIKRPFGMSLIKLMETYKKVKVDGTLNDISLNVINSVRLNSHEAVKVLIQNQLFPKEFSDLAYRSQGPSQKQIETVRSFMDKPLENGPPYSFKRICDNCLVVYKVLEKELKAIMGSTATKKVTDDLERDDQIFYGQYSLFKGHPHFYKNSIPAKDAHKGKTGRPGTSIGTGSSAKIDDNPASVGGMSSKPYVMGGSRDALSENRFRISRPQTAGKSLANGQFQSGNSTYISPQGAIFLGSDAAVKDLHFTGFQKILKMTNTDMNIQFRDRYAHLNQIEEETSGISTKVPAHILNSPFRIRKPKAESAIIENCNRLYLGYSTAKAEELFGDVWIDPKYRTQGHIDEEQDSTELSNNFDKDYKSSYGRLSIESPFAPTGYESERNQKNASNFKSSRT